MSTFRELVEGSKEMMYRSDDGMVKIKYSVRGQTISFSFKNKDGKKIDERTKFSRTNKDPELEIYNYLKSINY
jgi:hypothetical protein